MVKIFLKKVSHPRIIIQQDARTPALFVRRCEDIQNRLSEIQKQQRNKRIRVLWCFARMKKITHYRRRPFNVNISVRFMFSGFPYYSPYPTIPRLEREKYDVVVFEEMISSLSHVFMLNTLSTVVAQNGGKSVIVSQDDSFLDLL